MAENRQKLIIFSQNVLKCSCNTELIPEKLVLRSINDLFSAEKLENNANCASSAFFGKMMKIMLVTEAELRQKLC